MVSTQLQESSVTFLILPVSEDLKFTETVNGGGRRKDTGLLFSGEELGSRT